MRSPRRPALSRERILRAALGVVDSEGLEAISMRRVGDELSVEAMSLYNHVANKAALLDGIFELVLAELPPPRRAASWISFLRERGRALRAVLRAHPNALPLFATRPAATPASIAHLEGALQVLHDAGFSPRAALSAFQVLFAYVVGHSISAYAPRRQDEDRPAYEALPAETFPRVRAMARLLPTHDLEREFELGLDAMLLGIEAQRRVRS